MYACVCMCERACVTGIALGQAISKLIESQAQNVQSAAQFKNQNLSQTVDVMNRKIVEMRSGGGSGGGGGGQAV